MTMIVLSVILIIISLSKLLLLGTITDKDFFKVGEILPDLALFKRIFFAMVFTDGVVGLLCGIYILFII